MLNRRVLLSLLVAVALVAGGGIVVAKNQKHHDAHKLLGAKLKQNGKHEVAKIGANSVTADVNNGKVVTMAAAGLPVKKVKSKKKMASLYPPQMIQLAAIHGTQLAQVEVYYYAYCFETPTDEECFWYPAEDVIVIDGWIEYVPA
jgi:hypothetical protein